MIQQIEIEVPVGKKAIFENGQIKFIDAKHWENIKTFEDAYEYCDKNNIANDLLRKCNNLGSSYEDNVLKLRLIIAALTNDEKLFLTKGHIYVPSIRFCDTRTLRNCFTKNPIIGRILAQGKYYFVVGCEPYDCYPSGLGCYGSISHEGNEASLNIGVGFIKVSSKEIANHLSTYFGKLIFDVTYGGCNCDYQWIAMP